MTGYKRPVSIFNFEKGDCYISGDRPKKELNDTSSQQQMRESETQQQRLQMLQSKVLLDPDLHT